MNQPKPFRPAFAANFRCIGPNCEDTCCQGWAVPIDRAAYEKYRKLPAGPLRTLINASILVTPEDTANVKPAGFANIQTTAANQCPLLTEDRLCAIQKEYGAEFLAHACATYPRIVNSAGGIQETALSLSCPEAARLVLLNPNLLQQESPQSGPLKPLEERAAPFDRGEAAQDVPPFASWFWPIRESVLALVRNRAYPLWQRLFLLGILCRRLDSIARGEYPRKVPAFLDDFAASVASGGLTAAMENLPVDRTAQLDAVLRLAGLLLHRSNVTPRFAECIQAFTTGIGNGPGATLENLAARYSLAHDRYYAPFVTRYPHILENYLINTILRCQFPFGREGMLPGAEPSLTREFALLTAQFALMKGLLIGVVGCHRESFSAEHVVHTVQAASKHFEHHPEFLNLAHQLLVDSQLDGARGLAILLRNPVLPAPRPASPEIHVPGPRAGTAA